MKEVLARANVSGDQVDEVYWGVGDTSFSQEPLIVRGLRWKGFRLGDVKMEDPLYVW